MSPTRQTLANLLEQLNSSERKLFPRRREVLDAPRMHGVYLILDPEIQVNHVGRTITGKNGLHQRLNNHLHGASSFVSQYLRKTLNKTGDSLRDGWSYQYLCVHDDRERALLECIATAWHRPKHLGLGGKTDDAA